MWLRFLVFLIKKHPDVAHFEIITFEEVDKMREQNAHSR